jgi:hypothetical protein
MAYRFTNTEKWGDAWFLELDWRQKVVFLYLCDQCDVAGFYEINLRKMAWDIAIDVAEAEGALKGLRRKLLYSSNGRYLFLRNFIKQQKNLPLNGKNKAHVGIINRLNENLQLFNFQAIDEYFTSPLPTPLQGASKGLSSPTGIGKGIGSISSSSYIQDGGSFGAEAPPIPPAEKPKKEKRFIPPTVGEVQAYCLERKNSVAPQRFVDHYEARGWTYGRGIKMKDWKAAVRTWEQNHVEGSQQQSKFDPNKVVF